MSGASPNHPKKQMKNANHDMWNARIGALEKSASRMLVALFLRVISVAFRLGLCRVRVHRALSGGQIDQNNAVFHARREDSQTGGLRRPHRHARLQIEVSPMQRANHGRSGYDSVAQAARPCAGKRSQW